MKKDQLPVASEDPRDTDDSWTARFEAADGTVLYNEEAVQAMFAAGVAKQEERERFLASLTTQERRAVERYYATGQWPATRTDSNAVLFPQPRERAHPRERRAQRSSRSTSSSGSDDPGEPPPPAWRWRQPDGWLSGHGDVETAATTWRPSLRVRVLDALNPSLRRF